MHPAWYIKIGQLELLVKREQWAQVESLALELLPEIQVKAPSLVRHIELIITSIKSKRFNKQRMLNILLVVTKLAKSELSSPIRERILNEEKLLQELDALMIRVDKVWKVPLNFLMRKNSKDYKDWIQIGEDIESIPMTQEGRFRTQTRHQFVGERVTPPFKKVVVNTLGHIWPLVILWGLKKAAIAVYNNRYGSTTTN